MAGEEGTTPMPGANLPPVGMGDGGDMDLEISDELVQAPAAEGGSKAMGREKR